MYARTTRSVGHVHTDVDTLSKGLIIAAVFKRLGLTNEENRFSRVCTLKHIAMFCTRALPRPDMS